MSWQVVDALVLVLVSSVVVPLVLDHTQHAQVSLAVAMATMHCPEWRVVWVSRYVSMRCYIYTSSASRCRYLPLLPCCPGCALVPL
jgi:hypothetical protein